MENAPSTSKKEAAEESGHRSVAPEANQLHGKNLPPERIGHVLMTADIESAKPRTENAASMNRSQLLELSQEITVDNTTLRHIYDTHLIGENGLRRLVYEHMHGGNVREALHHEILEHETDFERDPQLRHQLLRRDQQPKDFNLEDLLTKAGITDTKHSISQPVSHKLPSGHLAKHLDQQVRQRKLLDFTFIGIILVLLILVVLLVMSRS